MKRNLAIIVLIVVILGLIASVLIISQNTETREKAAVSGGPAAITLSPGSTSFTEGNSAVISLNATIQSLPVDGFQVVTNITGSLPGNTQFQPTTVPGIQLAYSNWVSIPGGKQLQLGFVTQNPTSPLRTDTTIHLGDITFTAPDKGSLSVAFDPTLSLITQNQTIQDILDIPQNQTYTFTPNCKASQTLYLTPKIQSGTPGQTLEYTLGIQNEDNIACPPAAFDITTTQPSGWTSEVEQTPITVVPQTRGNTLVYFTSPTDVRITDYVLEIITTRQDIGTSRSVDLAYRVIAPSPSPSPPQSPSPSPSPSPIPSPSPSPSPIPSPSPVACNVADINKDGIVNTTDRSLLLTDFLQATPTNQRSDINGNGVVDVIDYSLLVSNYQQTTGLCQ